LKLQYQGLVIALRETIHKMKEYLNFLPKE